MSNQNNKEHKRHCMVVHAYYPIGEIRVEREARALVDRGFEVDIICLRKKKELAVETEGKTTIYRLPVKRHTSRRMVVQLLEYLAFLVLAFAKLTALHFKRRYRVVQVHNLPDFLVFAALVPKLTGARLILDLHDLMPEFYAARSGRGMGSWLVRVVRWQESLSCHLADHIITVTELWRQTLIERGLPADKVTVVMNVADDSIFFPAAVAQQRAKDDGNFHLIYHGNLPGRYGVDLAIRAVDLVRQKIPGIHLTIHSPGSYPESLGKLVDTLNLREHVHFSTRLMLTRELPDLIRTADVGIVPYRRDVFTDGILPTKLMEYVALGIPVIAACTPAISAYCDETMVQFFTPGDPDDLARCILTLYSDRKRLEQLARTAGKFNQLYNWGRISAEYVALVERLGGRR